MIDDVKRFPSHPDHPGCGARATGMTIWPNAGRSGIVSPKVKSALAFRNVCGAEDLSGRVATTYRLTLAAAAVSLALLGCASGDSTSATRTLPDISGLAWIKDNDFLAVHDAKAADGRARASFITLPASSAGPDSRILDIVWPDSQPPAADLESIARIPRTSLFLLVESGSAKFQGAPLRRIFLAEFYDRRLTVADVTGWPVPVDNVEGAAVTRVNGRLIFLFAERAEGQPQTLLRWADLTLQPLAFGPFREAAFAAPAPSGRYARPISAIDVDDAGRIYVASAVDTGNDHGPFRSTIWRIGRIEADGNDGIKLVLDREPERLATLDGIKVEGLAVRRQPGGEPELFFGTDDEHHGGILRVVPGSGV